MVPQRRWSGSLEEEFNVDKRNLFCAGLILLISCSAAVADLSSEFAGFDWVQENKVSGLKSSIETTKIPTSMFTLGPERVSYPSGIGQVPSPGGSTGSQFDEGGLGVKVQGANLVVQAAGAVNPQTGRLYSGVVYGQGDVFVTVDDSSGISNFALLNSWPSDGGYLALNGGHFNLAQDFHTGLGTFSTDLQGHLVSLSSSADVVLIGGTHAYTPGQRGRSGFPCLCPGRHGYSRCRFGTFFYVGR